jgi:hypothetical protein
VPEKVKTNNVPPEYQPMVLAAIAEAQERRAALVANGQLKDIKKILKEVYLKLVAQMQKAGVPEEQFLPEHHFYMASGLGRIVAWSLAFANEYPPTHRKGYGETYEHEITGEQIIFLFGGGGTGGPAPGPGEEPWPAPEELPDDTGFFEWVPNDEIERAQAMLDQVRDETDFGPFDDPLEYVRTVASRLGGKWGLNGKRGNANDPSRDILAWDIPGYQPQLFDVLIDAGAKNGPDFRALPYPQSAGAVWLAP